MQSAFQHTLIAIAMAALSVSAGCKSDSSYREEEKTSGEEVEAQSEHGDVAMDDANQADEYQGDVK
jgi:hypothetical protein